MILNNKLVGMKELDPQCEVELSVPVAAIIRVEKWKSEKPPGCKSRKVSTQTR